MDYEIYFPRGHDADFNHLRHFTLNQVTYSEWISVDTALCRFIMILIQ
jgi:hypothetical protein